MTEDDATPSSQPEPSGGKLVAWCLVLAGLVLLGGLGMRLYSLLGPRAERQRALEEAFEQYHQGKYDLAELKQHHAAAFLEVRSGVQTMPSGARPTAEADAELRAHRQALSDPAFAEELKGTRAFQALPPYIRQQLGRHLPMHLSVRRVADTALLVLDVRCRGLPEDVKQAAAAVANGHIELLAGSADAGRTAELRRHQQRRTDLVRRRDGIRRRRTALPDGVAPAEARDRCRTMDAKLRLLTQQLVEPEQQLVRAEVAVEILRDSVASGRAKSHPDVLKALTEDQTLRSLRAKLEELRDDLEQLRRSPQPAPEAIKRIEQRIAAGMKQMTGREKAVTDEKVAAMFAEAKSKAAAARRRVEGLRKEHGELYRRYRELQEALENRESLDEKDKALTKSIDEIDKRLAELRIRARARQTVVLRRVELVR